MEYTITLKFTADRELTETEKSQLLGCIEVQVEEPYNADGNEEEYTTQGVIARFA